MEKILHIETATDVCSVAVSVGEEIISLREVAIGKSHAGILTVFINNILEEANFSASSLDAVAVSMGPGSYTGLRIGVSVAKGICYGLNLPLIGVPTLESMYLGMKKTLKLKMDDSDLPDIFVPMIDARRMEIYMSVYNKDGNQMEKTQAFIVDSHSFESYLNNKKVCFFGSGALKIKDIVVHNNAIYTDDFIHSSVNIVESALINFRNKSFEDVAYFEPFYLKEFLATVPKMNYFQGVKNKA
jgi:tRNA threonylcarbamoyladenosine biosynthesis protein TsaB